MTTKPPLITCFSAGMLLFVAVSARADMPPLLPTPAQQQVLLTLSATDRWLSSFNNLANSATSITEAKEANPQIETTTSVTHNENVERARALLQRARETGDQRLLGQALHMLNQPRPQNSEWRLLRAHALQALHRFDPALDEIQQVLNSDRHNIQARLMLASLYSVRGEYPAALEACKHLLGRVPALLSGSCGSSVLTRMGQPQRAYDMLEQLYARTASTTNDASILHHAQVSLAEIADQLGHPAAATWWSRALDTQPKDLYTRIGATRNALRRGDHQQVVALSEHYTDIDALAWPRALALATTAPAEGLVLRQQLAQRVARARQFTDTLHARDQAEILLELLQRPHEALTLAEQNWQQQREPEDTALLLRAAVAAQRYDVYRDTRQWLAQWQQTHALYPTDPHAQETLQ